MISTQKIGGAFRATFEQGVKQTNYTSQQNFEAAVRAGEFGSAGVETSLGEQISCESGLNSTTVDIEGGNALNITTVGEMAHNWTHWVNSIHRDPVPLSPLLSASSCALEPICHVIQLCCERRNIVLSPTVRTMLDEEWSRYRADAIWTIIPSQRVNTHLFALHEIIVQIAHRQ